MTWFDSFRRDLSRYTEYSNSGRLSQVFTQQGLWALFQYRFASGIFHHCPSYLPRRLILTLMLPWQKLIEIATGICLPYSATIGDGLYLGHFGPIIIHPDATVGEDCNLSQGVTLGISGRGDRRGSPTVGNRVYIGANATVAGPILVGDDVVIGANSLVTKDIESGVTVVGVPAVKVAENNSAAYIRPAEAHK